MNTVKAQQPPSAGVGSPSQQDLRVSSDRATASTPAPVHYTAAARPVHGTPGRIGTLFLDLLDTHVGDARIRFRGDGFDRTVGSGRGAASAPDVTVQIREPRALSRALEAGNLGLGEAFMDGDFEIAEGSIEEFLAILLRNRLDRKLRADTLSALRIAGIRLLSILRGKQHNVRSHYDLGNDLFESFLDSKLTYSCGYACSPEDDLETLQTNKLDRICRKLRLERDERLLDIGCGFGGLLIHAAKHYGVTGVGITVSREHFEEGSRRIAREGLADRIAIELKDHLVLSGEYDKIVSVGMLEHVPRSEYRSYFRNIAGALRPGGRGLVHAVGCNAYRNEHDPFIQKYVFPASNQPRLSEITAELERNRLAILDVENMIRHYYYTARHWLERFRASRHLLPSSRYDGRFMRMWEYYLACCVAAAQASDSALYQVLFTNDYAAPISLQRV